MDGLALEARVTRREFLQSSSLGLLGLLLPRSFQSAAVASASLLQGRVIDPLLSIYERPSYTAPVVHYAWQDLVLPIQTATLAEDTDAYNRVWYRVGQNAYAYSGSLQPVEICPQDPATGLPPGGQLAEVSVPFTDARQAPGNREPVAYRLYYGTTHWVVDISTDSTKSAWYALYDGRLKGVYHAPARHLRLISAAELAPLAPALPQAEKRLEVRLESQLVIAYEAGCPVFMARAATGANWATGNYETPRGTFTIRYKSPSSHMAAGDRAAPNSYDLPGVPWVSYFTEDGISFHGTYWHNDFGKPRSHGCVNLPTPAARWIYRWTQPVVPPGEDLLFAEEGTGTRIDIL